MESFILGDSLTRYSSKAITAFRKLTRSLNLESSEFTNLVNFCDQDPYTFITSDYGYITYFIVHGNSVPVSADTDLKTKERFRIELTEYLRKGHKIVDTYSLYTDSVESTLKDRQASRIITASKLGMEVANKDSALRSMLKNNFIESRIVGIYTPDLKSLYTDSLERAAETLPDIPLSDDAKHSLTKGRGDKLLQSHLAAVSAYESFLFHRDSNYVADKLECKKAIIEMTKVTDPKSAKSLDKLDPKLFDVSVTNATSDLAADQYDSLFGKDFTDVLFPEIPEKHKNDIVRVGDRLYAFLIIERHPKAPQTFSALQEALAQYQFPYRVKTVTGGNAIDHFTQAYLTSRQQVAHKYFSFGAAGQQQYRKAFEDLMHYDKGNCTTMSQSVFTTWVDGEENEALLRKNIRSLKGAIESWTRGDATKVRLDSYTALESYFSTLPAYHQSTAPKLPIPLRDSLSRMPFIRPTLPKGKGGELVVTYADGKIDTLDLSVLAAQIMFICGASGRGKSVLNMKLRDIHIFARGNSNLPFEFNIEVGSSTKASIDSIKSQTTFKDQVEFYNIQNTADRSSLNINILSTPIGMREPYPHVKAAILALIKDRLVGEEGNELPRAEILLTDALNRTYRYYRQRANAKRIDLRTIPGLYSVLRELDFFSYSSFNDSSEDSLNDEAPQSFVGWDIVDFLIAHNKIAWASKVQSRTEILIEDVINIAKSKDFQESYNESIAGSIVGQAFLSALQGFVLKYPFVCSPSTTNIYGKHVVTFELGGVIRKGTSPGDLYENRFWFGLAALYTRSILFSSVDEHKEILAGIIRSDDKERPEEAKTTTSSGVSVASKVKEYLFHRLELIAASNKKFHIDELQAFIPKGDNHTASADYAGGLISSLGFEARKFHIELACSSQRPEHGRYLSDNATAIIILGFPSAQDDAACIDLFGVTKDESLRYVKELQLTPKKGINAFICLREVKGYKSSVFRQNVYIPIPGFEVWEYANSGAERHVRRLVQERFTYNDSMLLLTGALPQAGESPEFNQIENELRDSGAFDSEEINDDQDVKDRLIAGRIAKKLIDNAPMYIQFGKEQIAA